MASIPAMQSMPLLLRQSIRSSIRISRTAARPSNIPLRPTPAVPVRPSRAFSVCLQCQFRQGPSLYEGPEDKNKEKPTFSTPSASNTTGDAPTTPEWTLPEDAGTSRRANISAAEVNRLVEESTIKGTERGLLDHLEAEQRREEEERSGKSQTTSSDEQSSGPTEGARSGGLPSYLEGRRSKMSKQFTTMMDNIQSNVFVAGQRLNDLTGYSGIEALKKEIHSQGMQALSPRRKSVNRPK